MLEHISGLRILGIVSSLAVVVGASVLARRRKVQRADFTLVMVIAGAVLLAAIFPQLTSVPSSLLSLGSSPNGRIVTLIIFGMGVLTFLVGYERSKTTKMRRIINEIADTLALKAFAEEYPDVRLNPITVLIPAFNEQESIAGVLRQIPDQIKGMAVSKLVVIDGGTDATDRVAASEGAFVCRAVANRGGGAALRLGYKVALFHKSKCVVTMDADGQHFPEEIERLVEMMFNQGLDLVQGSRRLGVSQRVDLTRSAGIYVFSAIISWLTGQRITDSSNGFRAMKGDMLSTLILEEDQYYSSELLIGAIRRGYRVGECPVSVRLRSSGTTKKGKNLSYGLHYARVLVKTWLREL